MNNTDFKFFFWSIDTSSWYDPQHHNDREDRKRENKGMIGYCLANITKQNNKKIVEFFSQFKKEEYYLNRLSKIIDRSYDDSIGGYFWSSSRCIWIMKTHKNAVEDFLSSMEEENNVAILKLPLSYFTKNVLKTVKYTTAKIYKEYMTESLEENTINAIIIYINTNQDYSKIKSLLAMSQ